MSEYTITQVTKQTRLSAAVLDNWARGKLYEPSVRTSKGCGRPRLWSEKDICNLKALRILKELGTPESRLHPIAKQLKRLNLPAASGYLTIKGDRASIIDELTATHPLVVIPIATLADASSNRTN